MIGKICKARTEYYDQAIGRMAFKSRPALVLAQADSSDYVVLPVSTISNRNNIDPIYDVKVDPALYPKLSLNRVSYIRTHKQTIINRANLEGDLGDVREDYPELYLIIIKKREAFSESITKQACHH